MASLDPPPLALPARSALLQPLSAARNRRCTMTPSGCWRQVLGAQPGGSKAKGEGGEGLLEGWKGLWQSGLWSMMLLCRSVQVHAAQRRLCSLHALYSPRCAALAVLTPCPRAHPHCLCPPGNELEQIYESFKNFANAADVTEAALRALNRVQARCTALGLGLLCRSVAGRGGCQTNGHDC